VTAELTHEQAADEIEAVALGIAPDDVTQGVTAHAARCAECATELRSFYRVITSLAGLIPERQLNRGHSAGIKSRLLAKAVAGEESGGRRATRVDPVRVREPRGQLPRQNPIAPQSASDTRERAGAPVWMVVVALLIAAGSIAALLTARGGSDALDSGAADTPADDSRMAELERAIAEKDTALASVTGPGVRIISLFNREAREPLARIFWDRRSDRWTLFVYSLRQPRAGKTFQVWLGTDGGRIPLGTFAPASDGTAMFTARQPLSMAALNTVSISEVDSGSNSQSGPVVLAGALR